MHKTFLTAAVLASALIAAPAMAQDKKCSDEIDRVAAMQPHNTDAGKAEMAEAQLKIANELKATDEKGCMAAVTKAEKAKMEKN